MRRIQTNLYEGQQTVGNPTEEDDFFTGRTGRGAWRATWAIAALVALFILAAYLVEF